MDDDPATQYAVYYRGGFMDGETALCSSRELYPIIRHAKVRDTRVIPVPDYAPLYDPPLDIEEYNLRRDALRQLCYVKRGSGIKLSGWKYDGVRDDG